jgi:hypothetical protein
MNERECPAETIEAFEKATMVRAKAYAYIYEELLAEVGEEKADAIFKKAIYRLGADKAGDYPESTRNNAKQVAEIFTSDPVSRGAFGQSVLSADDTNAKIEMTDCALVRMWKEMGFSDEKIVKLCDLAYQVDFGKIESLGFSLKFSSRISEGGKSCVLEIAKK